MSKNPPIWLYHTDRSRSVEELLKDGFDPEKKIGVPFHRSVVDDIFPIRTASIYFFKGKPALSGKNLVKVRADKIPCRCIQADFNDAGKLNEAMLHLDRKQRGEWSRSSEGWLMNDIKFYKDRYKESIKFLDGKPDWCSSQEVLCPCKISPEVLELTSCEEMAFMGWKCVGFDYHDEDIDEEETLEDYINRKLENGYSFDEIFSSECGRDKPWWL